MTAPEPEETKNTPDKEDVLGRKSGNRTRPIIPEETLQDMLPRQLPCHIHEDMDNCPVKELQRRLNTYINKVAEEIIGPEYSSEARFNMTDEIKYQAKAELVREQRQRKDSLLGKGK